MPHSSRWREVTVGLRQLVVGIHPVSPFTYQGLIEFLINVKYELDHQGDDPMELQNASNKLIFDFLVQPIEPKPPYHTCWKGIFEHQQIRVLLQEEPEIDHYRRIRTMWLHFNRGLWDHLSTWMAGHLTRMGELIDLEHNVVYAPVVRLESFLAPPPSVTTNSSDCSMIEDSLQNSSTDQD